MKPIFCILLFFGVPGVSSAQGSNDFSWIDAKMNAMPADSTYASSSIARFILQQFSTDQERVTAAYSWITSNIHYNKDSMFYRFWGEDPERKLSSILRNRKAVCEDYALLFTAIANRCGIPAYLVTGFTKIMGRVKTTGHSWCAVKVKGQWRLCDPTWDENCYGNPNYFLIEPAAFIDTHFPFDPLWQLVDQPVSVATFKYGKTFKASKAQRMNYADSADAYLLLDTLQQKEASARRLLQSGLEDEQINTWYSYNNMKIRIVREEADLEAFNKAVADCNKAKALYNDFVNYRNNHFQPPRPEASTDALFNEIEQLLAASYQRMKTVGSKTENYQYDTEGLQQKLDSLSIKVADQKAFLKNHLANKKTVALPTHQQ